jgi:hypothetical protein
MFIYTSLQISSSRHYIQVINFLLINFCDRWSRRGRLSRLYWFSLGDGSSSVSLGCHSLTSSLRPCSVIELVTTAWMVSSKFSSTRTNNLIRNTSLPVLPTTSTIVVLLSYYLTRLCDMFLLHRFVRDENVFSAELGTFLM